MHKKYFHCSYVEKKISTFEIDAFPSGFFFVHFNLLMEMLT